MAVPPSLVMPAGTPPAELVMRLVMGTAWMQLMPPSAGWRVTCSTWVPAAPSMDSEPKVQEQPAGWAGRAAARDVPAPRAPPTKPAASTTAKRIFCMGYLFPYPVSGNHIPYRRCGPWDGGSREVSS